VSPADVEGLRQKAVEMLRYLAEGVQAEG